METKPTIRELIDACRADQHDPQRPELAAEMAGLARELAARPELAEVMERSERFDRNVRSALDDVALPAGLAERLLAKCKTAEETNITQVAPAAANAPAANAPAANAPAASAPAAKLSRRRMLAIFSTAASLLILLVGGWAATTWLINARRPVTNAELATRALDWFGRCGQAATWSAMTHSPAEEFPLDQALIYSPQKWRYVDPNDRQIVVYEMRHEGQRALLFVYKSSRPHNGIAKSPYTPLSASGGLAVGAWQKKGYVYVVVVTGGHGRLPLDTFIKRPKFT